MFNDLADNLMNKQLNLKRLIFKNCHQITHVWFVLRRNNYCRNHFMLRATVCGENKIYVNKSGVIFNNAPMLKLNPFFNLY